MEDREKVEEQLARKSIDSLCAHFKCQLDSIRPNGADIHKRGEPLHTFTITRSALEEGYFGDITTMGELKKTRPSLYKSLITTILYVNERFGIYIPS